MANSIITGSGSYIPPIKIPNRHFMGHVFYHPDGSKIDKTNAVVIDKLQEITGIRERRYVPEDLLTSDMAHHAAEQALENTEPEDLDYIIVAQNLGDIRTDNIRSDMVPSIAARVKQKLRIRNPYTVGYDIPFGCPGWLHGMILADLHIKAGGAKKVLVIGAETLSRVTDPHDRDSMIYSDGAGATLVESTDSDSGILSYVERSDTLKHADLLWIGRSNNPDYTGKELFVKMHGHDIYKYAAKTVPDVVKRSLDKAGLVLSDVKKVFIHQANERMDQAILERLFKLYRIEEIPEHIMPMTISWLGNSSVATLPTLYDLLHRGRLENHKLSSGDIAVFASVGAGMNINAMVYRVP